MNAPETIFQLQKSPLSLQELSVQFNISKTTLHHQLALLKAAKFIGVEKGIYSINSGKLEDFSSQLTRYLEIKYEKILQSVQILVGR